MPQARYYDLLVLLDPEAPEERRDELLAQIKRQIDSGDATLKGDADWGMRRLAFEIDHRREAQYHLFQFQAAADLLAQLDRSLSIEDGVLRHRIIRLPDEPPEITPKPGEDVPRRSDDRPAREEERLGDEEAPVTQAPPSEEPAEEAPSAVEAVPAEPQAVEEPAAGEKPAAEGDQAA
jgi:small subunit ribosomal protein S6